LYYKANWLLVVDNLSDFAHLAFVHTNTLGGSEEYTYKTEPVAVEKLDDGFQVGRWHIDADRRRSSRRSKRRSTPPRSAPIARTRRTPAS
jgi:phenylpropionate dioxygenase-like ring-hydroxylating dioxygenase large terminal subunit